MTVTIVIVARDPRGAKRRLRGALAPADRALLATAMLDDVLRAALGTRWPVLVVTDARAVAARARGTGAAGLVVRARGTRDGARWGVRRAIRDGADSVLVIAADLPLATAADLRRVVRAGRRARVVIVPDRRRSGTNALYLRPPTFIAPRFGRGSFTAHRRAAGTDGAVLTVAALGLDIDTPADLAALRRAKRRAGARTRATLG